MNFLILSSTLAIIAALVMPGHAQESQTQLSDDEYNALINEFRRLQTIFEDPSVPIETKQQHVPEWITFYENNHHLISFPKEFREKANRTYWMYKNEIASVNANGIRERLFGMGSNLGKKFLKAVLQEILATLVVLGASKWVEEHFSSRTKTYESYEYEYE
ncbi:uncharacterized protein [Drosophila bipectinata]|uniref:uncharacterized protein n=1 Tax=Drosophila bipectinata TaxID=42026 RepID=UPI0038B2EDD4